MIFRKLYVLLIVLCAFSINATESSKVFRSYEAQYDATTIISPAEKEGFFYIYFNGFEHHYDGNALLFQRVRNNSGYFYKLSGMPNVIFRSENNRAMINGTSTPYSEVYLDNETITRMLFSNKADITEERKVKKKYLERQLTMVSKVAAKNAIKAATKSFNETCNTRVAIDINWSKFVKGGFKTTPSKTPAYLDALAKICTIDADYAKAVKTVKTIKVVLSQDTDKHHAKLSGDTLTLAIGDRVPNIPETSYQLLYNIF